MREPAKSCAVCRRVLGPSDALYTPNAEIVCEACLASTEGAVGAPPRPGFVAPLRTRFERQRRLRTWALVWIGVALASVYAVHAARAYRRTESPVGIIDSPEPGEQVPETLAVRGWVRGTGQRSLWLVARWSDEAHCVGFIDRVLPRADGTFEAVLTLRGYLRQRIVLVAADGEAAGVLTERQESLAHAASVLDLVTRCNLRCEQLGGFNESKLPAGAVRLASATVQLEDNCSIP